VEKTNILVRKMGTLIKEYPANSNKLQTVRLGVCKEDWGGRISPSWKKEDSGSPPR
jgi:hypothetical protein